MTLTIQDHRIGDFQVIEVVGDIDIETAGDLRAHFLEHLVDPAARVVLDLSGVGFMDSSGLGALVSGWQVVRDEGEIRIAGANPAVQRVLSITGMEDVFATFASVDEAVAA